MDRILNVENKDTRVEFVNQFSLIAQEATFKKRVKVNLHIVQPGLSKAKAAESKDILQLLGVVKNYAFEVCNAELTVYCNL